MGRYSIIGLPASKAIEVTGQSIRVYENDELVEQISNRDPFEFIQEYQDRYTIEDSSHLPRFSGGLVGFFGFDCVRYVEPKLRDGCPEDNLKNPDIYLLLVDSFVIFDSQKGELVLVKYVEKERRIN